MKVSAILRKVSEEEGIVYIRINRGEKKWMESTKIRLRLSQFKEGKVVSHPKARLLNDKIRQLMADRQVNGVHDKKQKRSSPTFSDYTRDAFNAWKKTKKDSTLYQYKGEAERFSEFSGNPKLSQVTPDILKQYKTYLLKERTANTVWKSLKFLKTIFHKAVREGVIDHNPFLQVETIKYKNPEKQFLTKEQMQVIDSYVQLPETPERIAFTGNWFLIGCYTGLRFSDMQKFSKSLIREGRLILYTTKTGQPISLEVKPEIRALLERVKYKGVDLHNATYNQYLKVLSKACDLPPINAHMSRHTFAVRCADAGISPEVTARFMGIVNMKVVAIYYKLNNKRLDEEFDKLFS